MEHRGSNGAYFVIAKKKLMKKERDAKYSCEEVTRTQCLAAELLSPLVNGGVCVFPFTLKIEMCELALVVCTRAPAWSEFCKLHLLLSLHPAAWARGRVERELGGTSHV